MSGTRRTQVERSAATREALLTAARGQFAVRGYHSVSSEEIVLLAGVTRGALYHHFKSKADLFAAVVDSVEAELIDLLRSAAAQASTNEPVARMRAAIQAWLDACVDPSFAQIVLLDAPSVMGWHVWREVGERYGVSLAKSLLHEAAAVRPALQNAALPYILLGALREAGLYIAHSNGTDDARQEASDAMEGLIAALTTSPRNAH